MNEIEDQRASTGEHVSGEQKSRRLAPGASVVVVLHSPREKYWGVLGEINGAGIFLRGLDLAAFEDWAHAVIHSETFINLTDLFFPMWRVERLMRDERTGEIPSLIEQFESRTKRRLEEFL